ncbi:AAA family ATPase [Plantactinospora sp. B24E8]|uniref:AAA family ATPase n=1 Tax=Plantactinospora sp. B24E8 TaxID=3153567 RepID=UPI00325EAC34
MPTPEPETVDQLLADHLDRADLPENAATLVLAALLGEDEFQQALGGNPPTPPPTTSDEASKAAEPIGTYLTSIEVTGFRGIGPTATLNLKPEPGLTIVTGRNGSGKSSFAEAAEYALTGDNKRWSGRSSIWQDGWRNLHAGQNPSIRVRLGVDGHRNGATVEHHWQPEDGLADGTAFFQLAGEPRQSVAALGWSAPLELYRPFLSYAELGGLLSGRPSEMYDSLHRILGLGRIVEVETMLKTARREMDQLRKLPAETLPALRTALAGLDDERARQAEAALAGRVADLDQLTALATVDSVDDDRETIVPLRQLDLLELPSADEVNGLVDRLRTALTRIEALAATPAETSRAVAGLLRDALRHHHEHPDQPCPVCGGRTLDRAWADRAQRELDRLTREAEELEAAHRTVAESRRALRELVPPQPAALAADLTADGVTTGDVRLAWQQWTELAAADDPVKVAETAPAGYLALRAALEPVQAAAREALRRRRQAWQPVADQLRAWVESEQAGRQAARMYAALRKAVTWLQQVADEIRNQKLAPVAAEATGIWNTLRQESNVDLGGIRLAGAGPSRRVDLRVSVDGVPGAALGVMSQGELHSLALALFLPRATMPESPFRFLVIDDPVQSMDPVKVYGLAQVLARVAEHRQVIVFTHDDRLPAAVRHLDLHARVLTVSRLARSQVTVGGEGGNPALRYLADAKTIACDEEMAAEVKVPVVGNLVRDAIEYACHERVRARDFRVGRPIAKTEAALDAVQGLRAILALALLGDPKRVGELGEPLRRLHPAAPHVVRDANSCAHGGGTGVDLVRLVDQAGPVVERLALP